MTLDQALLVNGAVYLPQNSNSPTMRLNTSRFQTSMSMSAQMGARAFASLLKQRGAGRENYNCVGLKQTAPGAALRQVYVRAHCLCCYFVHVYFCLWRCLFMNPLTCIICLAARQINKGWHFGWRIALPTLYIRCCCSPLDNTHYCKTI